MKKIKLFFTVSIAFVSYSLLAQVSISIDGSSADGSAMLDVRSTEKGLLLPRMSTVQITSISNPAAGLVVFNTDSSDFYGFNGSKWISFWNNSDTLLDWYCGNVLSDIDGNEYNTVLIGTQCWMKENLKTTTFRNGTSIPNITDNTAWSNLTTSAYAWYNNDIGWKDSYGALYNWHTTVDASGLCPTGWHVPTNDEWTALTNYIGGTGFPHGNELKSCRQVNSPLGGACNTSDHPRWSEHGTQYGTDDHSFSGLPGGYRVSDGTFVSVGDWGGWWSSTPKDPDDAYYRYLHYTSGLVGVFDYDMNSGFSVRCLRD